MCLILLESVDKQKSYHISFPVKNLGLGPNKLRAYLKNNLTFSDYFFAKNTAEMKAYKFQAEEHFIFFRRFQRNRPKLRMDATKPNICKQTELE